MPKLSRASSAAAADSRKCRRAHLANEKRTGRPVFMTPSFQRMVIRENADGLAASEFHHAHPEHEFATGIDVVLAHVVEPAVGSDAEHRHAGGNVAHGGAGARGPSHAWRSHQPAAAGGACEGP